MREMKVPEFLFFLVESLTQHEKRHFRISSKFQSGDNKIYIQMFDILDKMGKKYNEEDLLALFGGDKKKLSVGKNFLYNKILRSLRIYNERSSTDIQLSNLISEAQILIQKGLFHLAFKRLKKAKKIAIEHEKSMLLVKIINIEIDISNHIGRAGLNDTFEYLFDDASSTLENYEEALTLKRFNRALHLTVVNNDKVHKQKYLNEIKKLPKNPNNLLSFYAKDNYHSVFAYYHARDYDKHLYHLGERVKLWEDPDNEKIRKAEYQLYRMYLSNYISGCIKAEKYEEILPTVKKIRYLPAVSNYEKASTFQNADYFELLYYIVTVKYDIAENLIPDIEKNIIIHRDSMVKSREVSFYYNIILVYFGLKEYKKAKKWLNKILYDEKSEPKKYVQRFAWILEIIIHHKLENDEVIKHIYSDAKFPMNQPNPHPFEVLAFGHLKKISFALNGRKALFKEFQKDLSLFAEENKHFGLDVISEWVEANVKNISFLEMQREIYLKLKATQEKPVI